MHTQYLCFGLPELIAAVVLCLPIMFQKEKKLGMLFVFLVSIFFYKIIIVMGHQLLDPQWLQYNWMGKTLVAIFALAAIYLVKRKNNNYYFGITFRQKTGSIKPVLYFAAFYLIVEILFVIFFRGQNNFSLEGHLYQSILPGITEEIVFRGLFLGLLNEIFPRRKTIFGAKLGYGALIVSLLFAFGHGLVFNTYQGAVDIVINWEPMIIPFYFAIVVVWMRERTGSVLIPIFFHNLVNELAYITLTLKSLI